MHGVFFPVQQFSLLLWFALSTLPSFPTPLPLTSPALLKIHLLVERLCSCISANKLTSFVHQCAYSNSKKVKPHVDPFHIVLDPSPHFKALLHRRDYYYLAAEPFKFWPNSSEKGQ